jgi:hypothetical protein
MDGGRTLEKVARAGRTAVTRTWSAISRTSAVLAVVMRFLAKRSERAAARYRAATGRLERISQVTNAKALGIPLGVDLAGEEWEDAPVLPLAEPPPIPPAAFFKTEPTPAEEAEWRVALEAAKHGTPEPATDEWTAAMAAAKQAEPAPAKQAEPAPAKQAATAPKQAEPASAKHAEPASAKHAEPPASAAIPVARPTASLPVRRTGELRLGPKPATPRAIEPRITLKGAAAVPAEVGGPKTGTPTVDPHVAAATKKTVAAALRT